MDLSIIRAALWALWCSSAAAGMAQWCSLDPAVDSCVAINSTAAPLGDLQFSISTVGSSGRGWAALGSGDAMATAAMIVFYPNAAGSELTVGVRTTDHGHAAPQMAEALMDKLEVHTNKIGELLTAQVTCHGCAVDNGSTWIWAFNNDQAISDANDFNTPLEQHTDFGRFALDEGAMLPDYPLTRDTIGVTPLSHHPDGVEHEHGSSSAVIVIHGMFMSAAFLFLFPLGAIIIRYPSPLAFRRHWILQVTAGGAVLLGAVFSLSKVLTVHTLWESFQKPHHGIGQVLCVAILLQALMGWKHHQDYVKLGRRTFISKWHMWLGRAILVLGMGNTAYGASFKHWLIGSAFMTWIAVLAIAACWGLAWFWVMKKYGGTRDGKAEQMTDEQLYELLDEDEDERDGRGKNES